MKKLVSVLLVLAILFPFVSSFAETANTNGSLVGISTGNSERFVDGKSEPVPALKGETIIVPKPENDWWEGRFVTGVSDEELKSFFYVEKIAKGFISRYNESVKSTYPAIQEINNQKLRLLGRHDNGNEYLYIDEDEKIEIYFKLDPIDDLKYVELTFQTGGRKSEKTWMTTEAAKTTAIIESVLYGCGMSAGDSEKAAQTLMKDYSRSKDKSVSHSKSGFVSGLQYLNFLNNEVLYLFVEIPQN